MSQISPHDEFLELCAISTSGQLAGEEHKRLQEHLAVCPSCREAMKQFEAVVSKIIPALARDTENLGSDPSWSQEQAEAAFFQRLTLDEEFGMDREDVNGDTASKNLGQNPPLSAVRQPGAMSGRFMLPAFYSSLHWAYPPIRSATGGE